MESDKYMNIEGMAEYLDMTKDLLYRWAAAGKIPAHKVGRRWKFKKDEIDKWVRSGKAAELG